VDGVVTLREAITSINNAANVNGDVVPAGCTASATHQLQHRGRRRQDDLAADAVTVDRQAGRDRRLLAAVRDSQHTGGR
jgi:hypothetical protein